MKDRQQKSRPGEALTAVDFELRSWISNVLVPAMVTEYLAEAEKPESVAAPTGVVAQSQANRNFPAGGFDESTPLRHLRPVLFG